MFQLMVLDVRIYEARNTSCLEYTEPTDEELGGIGHHKSDNGICNPEQKTGSAPKGQR
jgi:hypothetical protein